ARCVACLPQNDNCAMGSHCAAMRDSFQCTMACRNAADCSMMGAQCCAASCIDVSRDLSNCGACGRSCAPPPHGTAACVSSASALGWDDCTSSPSDGCGTSVVADVGNCGVCGMRCPPLANATIACVNAMCTIGMCTQSFADCDGNPKNGCEVNTDTDPKNC